MELKLKKPREVKQALCGQGGWNLFLEILAIFVVFLLCTIVQTIVYLPAELVMLFKDEQYLESLESGNISLAVDAEAAILNSEGMMIVMLFSEIIMILLLLGYCRWFQRRSLSSVGFTKNHIAREYLVGIVLGFAIFSAAVLICVAVGAVRINGFASNIPVGILILFFIGYMIQGMAEEVLCRGCMMVSVARRYPIWVAILANSVFFAMLHLANSGISLLAFINLVLFGIFASVYYIRRGNIWGIGAIHSVWNFTQGNFYGISVSGMDSTSSVMTSTVADGKELFNGGAFGLEGGLGVTIVLVAGILILYFGEKFCAAKEQEPSIKMVMFDLDGTLLPMDQDRFVNSYFQNLTAKLVPHGYEPKKLVDGIWTATKAMVMNDGSTTNEEAFWKKFSEIFGERAYEDKHIFDEFYCNEFQLSASECQTNPKAAETVRNLKALGVRVGLATNPIFPKAAMETRVRWTNLELSDFEFCMTYENSTYCKPNPNYYKEILKVCGLKPEECLMVGNNVAEDMVAGTLGMNVFLLTDCLINEQKEDISKYPHGKFNKLMLYLAETVV